MYIEEQEIEDWNIQPTDNNEIIKQKSISSYWLTNWYDKMKDITFKIIIYDSLENIPDILPFNKLYK